MKPITFAMTRLLLAITFLIVSLPVNSAADIQVTLQWDANDSAPDGYRLYYRTVDQEYDDQRSFDVGLATDQTIYDLEENTTYYFVVRAYVGDNLSDDSNEVAFSSSGQGNNAVEGDDASSGGGGGGCFIRALHWHP